jgi:hypothetical protein
MPIILCSERDLDNCIKNMCYSLVSLLTIFNSKYVIILYLMDIFHILTLPGVNSFGIRVIGNGISKYSYNVC